MLFLSKEGERREVVKGRGERRGESKDGGMGECKGKVKNGRKKGTEEKGKGEGGRGVQSQGKYARNKEGEGK